MQAVKETGYAGQWAVEIFSKELAMLPLDKVNKQAFTTTMAQFAHDIA